MTQLSERGLAPFVGAAVVLMVVLHCSGTLDRRRVQESPSRLGRVSGKHPVKLTPPADAIIVDGTATTVLVAGFGTVHPDESVRPLVGMAFIGYSTEGLHSAEVPFVLQDVRGLSPQWRQVVLAMVAGEVRRAWMSSEGGKVKVFDIELQAISESMVLDKYQGDQPAVSELQPPRQGAPESDVSRLGREVPGESVWPPPRDAMRCSDAVISKVVEDGTGTHSPQRHHNHVLGIAYAAYDKKVTW